MAIDYGKRGFGKATRLMPPSGWTYPTTASGWRPYLSHALVARGFLNREWIDEGAVYRDQRGNVVARFGRFEPIVDCLDVLLDLESHGPRTLLSSPRSRRRSASPVMFLPNRDSGQFAVLVRFGRTGRARPLHALRLRLLSLFIGCATARFIGVNVGHRAKTHLGELPVAS